MRRFVVGVGLMVAFAAGMIGARESSRGVSRADDAAARTVLQSASLDDLAASRATIVDLTYPLNERTAYWPGENYEPFRLRTIATLEDDGVLSKAFSMPEHLGTHLDAPNHFEKDRPAVDEIRPEELIGPGVVIDAAIASERNADHALTRREIEDWERAHGRVPTGAIVLLRTGWGRHWGNVARYQNRDAQGRLRFPGFSAEAARFLVEKRKVRGLGIDTLSIDPGTSRDFAAHHIVNKAGKYGLENVANLDELPPRDFLLIVSPLPIETGSGSPARIFAVVPKATPNGGAGR